MRREPVPEEANRELLRRMGSALRHGPTYTLDWHFDERTAIATIAPRPGGDTALAWDGDRTVCVALAGTCSYAGGNGGREGRATPSALVRTWRREGECMAPGLRGEFVVGILDAGKTEITLIVGPFGLRRLYYAVTPHIVLFAPEVKAILACREVEREVDDVAIADLVSLSYVLGERTLFRAISRVPAGTMLRISPAGVDQKTYVQPGYGGRVDAAGEEEAVGEGEAVVEVIRLLRQAAARQVAGAARVGVSLSGGLDSRLVLALAREEASDVGAYTFGTYRNEERKIAQTVAEAAGADDYSWLPLRADRLPEELTAAVWMTDGMIEATSGRTLNSIREQAGRRDMLLVGLYGESILGGDKFTDEEIRTDLSLDEELAGIERGLGLQHNLPLWQHIFDAGVIRAFEDRVRGDIAKEYARSRGVSPFFSDRKDHFFLMHRARRYLGEACLESYFASDGFLFFDYDLVSYLLSLPPAVRAKHRLYAQVMARACPVLAGIPWQRTGAPVYARAPRTRRWRRVVSGRFRDLTRKASLGGIDLPDPSRATDFDRWYRVSHLFRRFVRDALLDRGAVCRPWYRPGGAERLLRWQDAGKNYSFLISRLLALELYWRELGRRGLDGEVDPGTARSERGMMKGGTTRV